MEELETIRSEIANLLDENDVLPSDEQLVMRAFCLDDVAWEGIIRQAEQHVATEQILRATKWIEQQQATETVLHECWHRMLVKPRCIKAIDGSLYVRNFALVSEVNNAQLEQELARHELILSVTRLISFKPWQTMTDSELEQRLNASPLDRRSFKSVAEGVQKLVGKLNLSQTRASPTSIRADETSEQSNEDFAERAVESGSTTHLLLTPELSPYLNLILPFQQIDLNTGAHEAAKHALCLTVIIRDLKHMFNTEFDELWMTKEKELLRFQEVSRRLKEIDSELREKRKEILNIPQWNSEENPDLVIVEQEKTETTRSNSSLAHSAQPDNSVCGRALIAMMDDLVETRWQEQLAREPTPPPCLVKDSNTWNEEERCAAESYEKHLANLRIEREAYRMKLLQDQAQLIVSLKEGYRKLDVELERLSQRRMEIEAAIRQEELKISRVKLWSLARAAVLRYECKIRQELKVKEENLEQLSEQRLQLLASYEAKRKYHDALVAHDRQQAQSFRREFTHLSPMVVDQLTKWFKKRPAVQLSATQLRILSQKLGPLSHVTKGEIEEPVQSSLLSPEDISEPWRMYLSALRAMDITNHASGVDAATWSTLCRLRRIKTEAEIRVKASVMDIADAEFALAELDVTLMAQRKCQRALITELLRAVETKRHLLLDTEVQLLLPRGQIELRSILSIKECETATVVPLETIRALNRDIREAGAHKLACLRIALKFRAGHVQQAEWLTRKAEAEAALLEEELAQVHRITISSEVRQFLKDKKQKRSTADKKAYEETLYRRRVQKLMLDISTLRRTIHQTNEDVELIQRDVDEAESELMKLRKDRKDLRIVGDQNRLYAEQSRFKRKIQLQNEELQELRHDLEKMKLRTFPTLFDVSL